jgi:guanylate kinase
MPDKRQEVRVLGKLGEKGRKGRLFVLTGPSGVGKGTLRARAFSDIKDLVYSISCTTRKPRGGERDGVDYHFVTREDFQDRVARGMFLEHAAVHEDLYGTLREDVVRETDAGRDVLLEIDVQGARQIRKLVPDSVLVFIAPPSLDVLELRLRRRGTESEEQIALRLDNAQKEMKEAGGYDHVILNDDLKQASEELRGVISSYR